MALLFVSCEGARIVTSGTLELFGEDDCILYRHGRTLGDIRQHRMCGITQYRNPPATPASEGVSIAQDPHTPGVDLVEHRFHIRNDTLETAMQLFRVSLGIPSLHIT